MYIIASKSPGIGMPLTSLPDWDAIAKVASPILVAVVGAIVRYFFRERPKLVFYFVHSTSLPLPPPVDANGKPQPQTVAAVHTHAVVVRNVGNKTATKVRIAHDIFPLSHRLNPMVSYTVEKGQENSAEIVIPALVPGEQVTISYLYFPPLTWNQIGCYVRSEEGMARQIAVLPNPPLPKPVAALLWALIFVGASTVVYGVLQFLAYMLKL